ncbi:ABC transporter permease [Paenibacillus protaetiae]|uniref:ABC transporter permease n=1 Tax=Paenibacillus protaetiae TaxID=2509456 RepID=A0A4P6EXI9_9BACL|nr:ABC transporter permease [Paenibacillus protaetiae]QAY66943.1 ABC transporter permease [Paenibacillus protaetiae]
MNKRFFHRWAENYGLFLLLLAALLAAWEMAARLGWVPSFILPAPTSVGQALADDRSLLLGKHLPATLREAGLGFAVSVAIGTVLGVLMHTSRLLAKALYPFIVISQTIPLIALSPVLIMWLGYTIWAKAAIVFLTAFFPVVVSTYDGLSRKNNGYAELLLTMGATRAEIFRKVSVPLALPAYFSGLKLAIVYCVVGATIGEWLGGTEGLGYFSKRMSGSLHTDSMFAAILLLSLLGIVLFAAVAALERLILQKRGYE